MSEAKKSYLIDAEQFRQLLEQSDKTIPAALTKVANTDMPEKQKFYEYSELYNKYINDNALKRRPLQIIEHQTTEQQRPQYVSPKKKMKTLPKSYVNRGLQLYNKLKENKNIRWDDKNVYVKNVKIGEADIADFIKLYTSKRKNIKVKGFNQFKTFVDNFLALQGRGLDWLAYSFD